MKRNNFTSELSQICGVEPESIEKIVNAMAQVLAQAALERDTIAVPGFGTFYPVKTDEYETLDEASGKRMLQPPHIDLRFRPSVILRKNLE